MTRDEVAKKIHWSKIFWVFGFINVGAMFPQLIKIICTGETKDLAVGMFVVYFFLQIAFAFEGYFKRNRTLVVCMGLSSLVSATIIVLILHLR